MIRATTTICLAAAVLLARMHSAVAEKVDPATIREDDVGPPTPYGETPREAANKKVPFEWVYTNMVLRDPSRAFATYVSRDYCNHGHLSTLGRTDCVGYDATRTRWMHNYGRSLRPGEKIEIPRVASVNDEMVTMYGDGVDIFRVHDGKITDHWDASPPGAATIQPHAPGFTAWVLGPRSGPPPMRHDASSAAHVLVTPALIDTVDVGPPTPYGETAQEASNKRVVFEWMHRSSILGDRPGAFARYVSLDFCDHSHMANRARTECAGFAEVAKPRPGVAPARLGSRIEVPTMASVDGEMVTMYGAGVDVFRVHGGKITDHWDATPAVLTVIPAHSKAFTDGMAAVVSGSTDRLPVGPPSQKP